MFNLFKSSKDVPQQVIVRVEQRDYRAESALRNMGLAIIRCNGRMSIIKRNHNSVTHPDFLQLQVQRDYMRRLLGHI